MLELWDVDVEHVLHVVRELDVLDFESITPEGGHNLSALHRLTYTEPRENALEWLLQSHMWMVAHHLPVRLVHPFLQPLHE